MEPFHILFDEMGLDQMGLDKVGRPLKNVVEATQVFLLCCPTVNLMVGLIPSPIPTSFHTTVVF